ncbi:MAG: tRNA lysidine(34) synthetase TilS [Burkholderiales bacterium]
MSSPDLFATYLPQLKILFKQGSRVCVGFSGGLDSVVLLDCLHRLQDIEYYKLFAIHVNHQLSPNANSWAQFCTDFCARKNIPLQIETVNIAGDHASGIEAAARDARHGVFKKQTTNFIALAHHADDQAETLLLLLLRGAGVKGASAMPLLQKKNPLTGMPAIVRPLLEVTRIELEQYATQRGLKWISDESNADIRYDRNYMRHEVMPQIEKRFPAYRVTFGRAAQHFAEASALLDELAAMDVKAAMLEDQLSQAWLMQLSKARAKNLLRYFLARHGVRMPQAARLDDLVRQLQSSGYDAEVCVELGRHEVRAWRGRIYLLPIAPPDAAVNMRWNGETEIKLTPLMGVLKFVLTTGQGVSVSKLSSGAVTVRSRSGGETLQLAANRPRRTLKNLLQESEVPPWERERLPLLFYGDRLVWVPGIGVDINFQAVSGEAGYSVDWVR